MTFGAIGCRSSRSGQLGLENTRIGFKERDGWDEPRVVAVGGVKGIPEDITNRDVIDSRKDELWGTSPLFFPERSIIAKQGKYSLG